MTLVVLSEVGVGAISCKYVEEETRRGRGRDMIIGVETTRTKVDKGKAVKELTFARYSYEKEENQRFAGRGFECGILCWICGSVVCGWIFLAGMRTSAVCNRL